jgi:hypothetical protein
LKDNIWKRPFGSEGGSEGEGPKERVHRRAMERAKIAGVIIYLWHLLRSDNCHK